MVRILTRATLSVTLHPCQGFGIRALRAGPCAAVGDGMQNMGPWRSSHGLSNASLWKDRAYINGERVDVASGKTYEVTNPADGKVLAEVAAADAHDTKEAITAASNAWPAWRAMTAKARGDILKQWAVLMQKNTDDLARIMTLECGKPIKEAKGEVAYALSFLDYFGEEGKRTNGLVIPSPNPSQRLLTIKQPVGVCGIITPWNFPAAMITRKVGPALAAGCTVVCKPAEDTPLTALAMAQLAQEAGVPPGVFNVVPCPKSSAKAVGQELCSNPDVRKISFTGSTAVGKILMQQAASTIKKVSLELGGNAPFIVFDDADLDAAVAGCIASKFRYSGQTCVCTNRIYVQAGAYDSFAEKLAQKVRAMKVGNGLDEDTQLGPLINKAARDKVAGIVQEALDKGAHLLAGDGEDLGGNFWRPMVLTDVKNSMRCCREEIFGPVAPLVKFDTEDEVLREANSSPSGLAGYFYTRDYARIFRFAEALEVGMVGVNEGIISKEVVPFGGVKESGLGREGSVYGIDEYMEVKHICIGGLS